MKYSEAVGANKIGESFDKSYLYNINIRSLLNGNSLPKVLQKTLQWIRGYCIPMDNNSGGHINKIYTIELGSRNEVMGEEWNLAHNVGAYEAFQILPTQLWEAWEELQH